MIVTQEIHFDVNLSPKERKAIKTLLGVECTVERIAKLSVTVQVPLQDKTPLETP